MSWDVTLTDDRGHTEGDWNYTHNTNHMIAAALKDREDIEVPPCGGSLGPWIGPAWWYELNGKSGPDGAAYLARIIEGLEADPAKYRAMNPDNGWGDYESLVRVLAEMRDRVPDWPTSWAASG
jgi:hypothetical protein